MTMQRQVRPRRSVDRHDHPATSRATFQRRARPDAGRPTVDDLALSLNASPVQLDALDSAVQSVWDAVIQREADQKKALKAKRSAHVAARSGTSGPSHALPHLDQIQRAFGPDHDLSAVQAHVGGAAADACDDLHAHAYASGDHVAFAKAPSLELAAHEAAHVVQQRSGRVQLSGGVGQVGDAWERNADAVAARVVAGRSAVDLLTPGGAGKSDLVQREEKQGGAPAKEESAASAVASAATPDKGTGGYKWRSEEFPLGTIQLPNLPVKAKGSWTVELTGKIEQNKGAASDGKPRAEAHGDKPAEGDDKAGEAKPDGEKKPDGAKPDPGPQTQVEANRLAGNRGTGFDAKVKQTFSRIRGFTPEVSGGVELTDKGGKIALGGAISTEWGPVNFTPVKYEFAIIKVDTKVPDPTKGGKLGDWSPVKFAVSKVAMEAELKGIKIPIDNGNIVGSAKFSVGVELSLNEVGAIKQFAQHLTRVAAERAGAAAYPVSLGAAIAGTALGVFRALTASARGDANKEVIFGSVQKCRDFCQSYANVLSGREALGSEGGQQGAAEGRKRLGELSAVFPEPLLAMHLAAADLYGEAWKETWPQIKQAATDWYWANNKVEKFLTGGEGWGSDGYWTFARHLAYAAGEQPER